MNYSFAEKVCLAKILFENAGENSPLPVSTLGNRWNIANEDEFVDDAELCHR